MPITRRDGRLAMASFWDAMCDDGGFATTATYEELVLDGLASCLVGGDQCAPKRVVL